MNHMNTDELMINVQKLHEANSGQKNTGIAALVSDTIDVKGKSTFLYICGSLHSDKNTHFSGKIISTWCSPKHHSFEVYKMLGGGVRGRQCPK